MTEVAPGKWRLRVYAGTDPATGKPKQKAKTVKATEAGARKALKALAAEAASEKVITTSLTLDQALTAWLDHIESKRAKSTIAGARKKIARFISVPVDGTNRPALGSIPLTKLTAHDLDRFYNELLARGLSTTTVRQYHSIIAAALHQAERWDWIPTSPARKTTPPTARKVDMKVPTPAELIGYVQAADKTDQVLSCAISLAALTGLRRGELCALRWSDVNMETGVLVVSRSLTVIDKQTHEGPTKTHQVRRVSLDDVALETLKLRHSQQVAFSDRVGSPLVADPYILSFNGNGATSINPDTLSHRFSAICDGKYRLHDLRHFSVSTLISAGVDVQTVAERHGHADASITLRVYAHARPEEDRAAASILGAAMTPKQLAKP